MNQSPLAEFNADLISSCALLQEENAALNATVTQQRVSIEEQHKTVAKLESSLAIKSQTIEYYKERLRLAELRIFGRSSEKRTPDESLSQNLCFPFMNDEERPSPPPEEEEKEKISYERNKQRKEGRPARADRFPEHLRRVISVHEPEEKICPCCNKEMTHKVKTEVTEKLSYNGDPFFVHEHHRPVYGCRQCESFASPAPVPEVLEGTMADHTVQAHLLVDKFQYSVPLYRQGQIMRDMGIKVANDTLITWTLRSLDLLAPVGSAHLASVLSSTYLMVDDTRFPAAVGKVNNKLPGYKRGCLWGLYGDKGEVAYVFSASRTHQECHQLLAPFSGYLICDGYDGFERVAETRDDITLVNCNSHARRKFIAAEGSDKERATEAIAFYQALYRVERDAKEMTPQERLNERQHRSVPILERLLAWLNCVVMAAKPKSPLGKACAYVLKRWGPLTAFTEDGNLPLDTNELERQFRVVAVGRKNYLHAASESGAQGAALAYSLINSCKILAIDPFVYLCDVFERVDTTKVAQTASLTPRVWKDTFMEEAMLKYKDPLGALLRGGYARLKE